MRTFTVLCIVAFIGTACAADTLSAFDDATRTAFGQWAVKHNKIYSSANEYRKRMMYFAENMREAAELTAASGGHAEYGANEFSDLSHEEWASMYLMPEPRDPERWADEPTVGDDLNPEDAPESFDWREQGTIVTPIKNQGNCGSCWAFGASATIEAVWQLAGNDEEIVAPQQLVDCDSGCYGCNGGDEYITFGYVIGAGGIEDEKSYPYKARQGSCQADSSKFVASLSSRERVTRNEKKIPAFIAENGPCSTGIDATQMMSYKKGIIGTDGNCSKRINHAVNIVGYGSEDGQDYWIVRNSWGKGWGEKGFFRVARGIDACAISQDNSFARA